MDIIPELIIKKVGNTSICFQRHFYVALHSYKFASSALSPVLTIMDDIITLTVYFPDVTYDRIQEHTETEFNVAEQLAVMKGMV